MSWGRLDDKANGNAKLLALSDAAWRMWGAGLIYCQDNLTDGFIPDHAIYAFGVRARNKVAIADELCRALVPNKGPLWHKTEGGFQVHDYLDWNDAREKVLAEREKSGDRLKRFRKRVSPPVSNGVRTPFETRSERVSTTTSTEPLSEAPPVAHPIRELLGHYQTRYEAIIGTKPHIDGGKDAAAMQALLKQHDAATVQRAMDAYFDQADDFVKRRGYTLGLFRSQFNAWLAKAAPRPSVVSNPARDRYGSMKFGR